VDFIGTIAPFIRMRPFKIEFGAMFACIAVVPTITDMRADKTQDAFQLADETLRLLKMTQVNPGPLPGVALPADPKAGKLLLDEGMVVQRRQGNVTRLVITQIGLDALASGGSRKYLEGRQQHKRSLKGATPWGFVFGGLTALFNVIMRLADRFRHPTITGQY
jgi:hypothetical protein